jgi:hypothetical protein
MQLNFCLKPALTLALGEVRVIFMGLLSTDVSRLNEAICFWCKIFQKKHLRNTDQCFFAIHLTVVIYEHLAVY